MGRFADPRAWVDEVRRLDREISHWPGPRPLTADDGPFALVGRDEDLDRFIQNITHRRLTHLIGPSGVGKSSLLRNKIVPLLKERGYTVALCRDWSNIGDLPFEVFLAERLYDDLDEDEREGKSRDTELFWQLDDLGGVGVVILDQFEELVRMGGKRRRDVFEFLAQLYLQTNVPVVLSYRSEFKEELADFDRDMRISNPQTQRIDHVDPVHAREVLVHPRRPGGAPANWDWTHVIDPAAVAAIVDFWAQAHQEDAYASFRVGLLHLQALMFVLSDRASGVIDPEDFEGFCERAELAGHVGPHAVMNYALDESATTRLQLARRAGTAQGVGMDEHLLRGVMSMLTRIVPHLSSGGFKLERQVTDLALTVLEEEIGIVTRWLRLALQDLGRSDVDAVVRAAIMACLHGALAGAGGTEESVLSGPRAAITAAVDALLNRPLGEDAWANLLARPDTREVTAGPMMGRSPVAALLEQLRRFGWAVLWLHELNLARLNADGSSNATLTLVHDGFGDALQRWSEQTMATDRTETLFALIAPEGESHDWERVDYAKDLCGEPGTPRLHANLRLKGNSVLGADLRHVVFVNCDFRGTLFLRCSFDSVAMLNCRLDGALFSDCTVEGMGLDTDPTEDPEHATSRDRAPVFAFREDIGRVAAQALSQYAETPGTVVVAPEPGRAAYAAAGPEGRIEWSETTSGLRIQGSRLSALTFRGITFRDEAGISFVNVAGSGLDLAELTVHDGGTEPSIQFRESVLRHTALTAHDGAGTVNVEITGSVMAQGWVGAGLIGELRAEGSMLVQWWVEAGGYTARLGPGCTSIGNAGFKAEAEAVTAELPGPGAAVDPALAGLREKSSLMDYRRD